MTGSLTMARLLLKMKEVKASDLHLKPQSPPVLRIGGELHRVDTPAVSADELRTLLDTIIPAHLTDQLETRGGIDFSHHEGPEERFRCSVFSAGHTLHAAIRRVNPMPPSFACSFLRFK